MSTAIFTIVFIAGVAAIIAYQLGGLGTHVRLRGYGIVVDGSAVKTHGRVLGDLAGSRAEIGDMTSRHALTRVVTAAGALAKKTGAYLTIAFANGNTHQQHIKGATHVRQASAWVTRYNAMASAEREPGQATDPDEDGIPFIGPEE